MESSIYCDLPTETSEEVEESTKEFSLNQNFPNPFNPSTTITFTIPNDGNVQLKLYDVLGNEVVSLINENLPAGYHTIKLNGSELTNGVYFYKLQAENFIDIKKLILLK